MFAYLEGRVTEKRQDEMVLDVGGVGFLISVTPQTMSRMPGGESKCRVYTKLVVKEDAWDLNGFASREEPEMFEKLTAVSGVGPKTALGVLAALPVRDLALAIVTGDLKAIKSAPGIGPKTAQRILLELKDKVSDEELVGEYALGGGAPAAPAPGGLSDALAALMALGYTQGEAAGALNKVKDQSDKTEELIRLALRAMSQM